jgi:hypothetical protein
MEADAHRTGQPALPANGRALTDAEIGALPPVVDLTTAARVLGVGRSLAYELARTGGWPTPVLRIGSIIRVPTAPLLALVQARMEPRAVTGPTRLVWHERGDLGAGL